MENVLHALVKEFLYIKEERDKEWDKYNKNDILLERDHNFIAQYEEHAFKIIHPAMMKLLKGVRKYGLQVQARIQEMDDGVSKLYYDFSTHDDSYGIQIFIGPDESGSEKIEIDFDFYPFEPKSEPLYFKMEEVNEEFLNALFIKTLRKYIKWMYDGKIPPIEKWSER